MTEERSARKAMHSKRQEIEALQSIISRVKSVVSVDDIRSRVRRPMITFPAKSCASF